MIRILFTASFVLAAWLISLGWRYEPPRDELNWPLLFGVVWFVWTGVMLASLIAVRTIARIWHRAAPDQSSRRTAHARLVARPSRDV